MLSKKRGKNKKLDAITAIMVGRKD